MAPHLSPTFVNAATIVVAGVHTAVGRVLNLGVPKLVWDGDDAHPLAPTRGTKENKRRRRGQSSWWWPRHDLRVVFAVGFVVLLSIAALCVGFLDVKETSGEILHLFPSISLIGVAFMLCKVPTVEDSFSRDTFSIPEALLKTPILGFVLSALLVGVLIPQFLFGDAITAAMQTVAVLTVLMGSHPRISRHKVDHTGHSSLRTVIPTPTVGNKTDGLHFSTKSGGKLSAVSVAGAQFPSREYWAQNMDVVRGLAKERKIVEFVKQYKRILMNMLENDMKGLVHDKRLDRWTDAFRQLAMADRYMMTKSDKNKRPMPCQNLWYMLGVLERASWRSGVKLEEFHEADGQSEALWNMLRGLSIHFRIPEDPQADIKPQIRSMAELFYTSEKEENRAKDVDAMEKGLEKSGGSTSEDVRVPEFEDDDGEFGSFTHSESNHDSSTLLLSDSSQFGSLDGSSTLTLSPGIGDTTSYISSTSDPTMASSSTAKAGGVTPESSAGFEPITPMLAKDVTIQRRPLLHLRNEKLGSTDDLPADPLTQSDSVSILDSPELSSTDTGRKTVSSRDEEGELSGRHVRFSERSIQIYIPEDNTTPAVQEVMTSTGNSEGELTASTTDASEAAPTASVGTIEPSTQEETWTAKLKHKLRPREEASSKLKGKHRLYPQEDTSSESKEAVEILMEELDDGKLVQEMRTKYERWFEDAVKKETEINPKFPSELSKAMGYMTSSWPARMLVLIEYFWTTQWQNAGGRFQDPDGTPASVNERYRMQYALLEQCMLVQSAVLIFAASIKIISSLATPS